MTEVKKFPAPRIKPKPIQAEVPEVPIDSTESTSHKLPKVSPVLKPVVISLNEWRESSLIQLKQYLLEPVAKQLEEAIYDSLIQTYKDHHVVTPQSLHFQRFYQFQVRDLADLLDVQSKHYQFWLVAGLNDGVLDPKQVVIMKPWELSPAAWQPVIQQFKNELSSLGKTSHASSTLFECGRCHKKDTSYYEMQTRSSDEPMTTYITCNNCGNHWKQ